MDLARFNLTCSSGDLYIDLRNLLVPGRPFSEQHIHLKPIDFRKTRVSRANDGRPAFEMIWWDTARSNCGGSHDAADLIQRASAALSQALS